MTLLFSFIISFFWGALLAILLWIVAAYWGKLVYFNFKASKLQHLLLFVIAVVTCVCFGLIFNLNKVNGYVKKAQTFVVEEVAGRIQQSGASLSNIKAVNVDTIAKMVKQEYPMLSKYMNSETIAAQVGNLSAATSTTQAAEMAVTGVTKGISHYVKSARTIAIVVLIMFQLIAFGAVTYSANKAQKRAAGSSLYTDYSDDYSVNYD